MENKELLTECESLLFQFDSLIHNGLFKGRQEQMLLIFWVEVSGADKVYTKGGNVKREVFERITSLAALAFSFGFAIGQTVEPTDPEDRQSVKAIMEVIRDKGLLPYIAREKKASRKEAG